MPLLEQNNPDIKFILDGSGHDIELDNGGQEQQLSEELNSVSSKVQDAVQVEHNSQMLKRSTGTTRKACSW